MRFAVIGTSAASIIHFRGHFISEVAAKGILVYAYACDYNSLTRQKVKEMGAIPVDYDLDPTGINPVKDLYHTFRLFVSLRKYRVDRALLYFTKPVVFGALACKMAGVKHIYGMLEGLGYTFIDCDQFGGLRRKLIRKIQITLYRITFPMLSKLILLNEDDHHELVVKCGLRIPSVVILGPIGVDLDYFHSGKPAPKEKITFLFIGRLLFEKGILEFVEAARAIKTNEANVEFIVLGADENNNSRGLTRQMIDEFNQTGDVKFVGHVSNVKAWIEQSSVFVLPSYREGVPRSTQEAMAVGRAVITTDVPGCRETVVDGRNGFLVSARDSTSLRCAMEKFIADNSLISKMGQQSRELAQQKFDVKSASNKLICEVIGDGNEVL